MTINKNNLRVDPLRAIYIVDIPIRAEKQGKIQTCDIGQLTRESFLQWILQVELLPLNTVLTLLAHERVEPDEYTELVLKYRENEK